MTFNKWLEVFLDEKGIQNKMFVIEHDGYTHYVEQEALISFLKLIPVDQKNKIKDTFVKIDFMNGDCMHFLNHLAEGYVKTSF